MLIYIVEDDPRTAKLVSALLNREGFSTKVFNDAAAFFADAAQPVPALLIVDLLLPGGFDGFKVCENVRHSPRLKAVPIIVMTSLQWRGDGQLSSELMQRFGVAVLLKKPFARAQLFDGVDKVLQGWREQVTPPPKPVAPPAAKVALRDPLDVKPISKTHAAALPNLERESPRVPQRFAIEFASVDKFVTEYTQNISAGGMFVKAKEVPAPFSEIVLSLHLPDGKPPVDVAAVVVHATAGVGFGVQLKKASPRVRDRWQALLAAHRPAKLEATNPNARLVVLFNFSPAKTAEIGRMLGLLWRPEMLTAPAKEWDDLLQFHQLHLVILDASQPKSPLADPKEIARFFAHFSVPLVLVGTFGDAVNGLKARYPMLTIVPAITSDKLLSKLGKLLHVPVRTALRVPVRLPGVLGKHACVVADLSLSGARLEVPKAVSPGLVATLHVELRDDISIGLEATVRWVRDVDGVHQAGVSFDRVEKQALEVLDTFVEGKSLLLRGIAAVRQQGSSD